jgi:hypothetical protein
MKLPLRYKILLYIILPLVILSYLPTICLPYLTGLNENSTLLYNELTIYAYNNNGFLPSNNKDILVNTRISEKALERFGIAYGIDVNKITKKENQLYDEKGKKVLLIYPKGFKFWLKDRCENLSLQLYDMVEETKENKEE